MAVPLPNLTLSTPSTATSSGVFSPNFAVGRGASAGGVPVYVWIAGLAIVAIKLFRSDK